MTAGDLITANGQIEWGGLLLGDGTPYWWRQLDGWDDLPAIDSADVPRPARDGSWPGLLLAQERVLTLDFRLVTGTASFDTLVEQLRAVTQIVQDEAPLVVQLRGRKQQVNARITRRALPVGMDHGLGIADGALQWVATDPRRYGTTQLSALLALPQPGTGMTYPLNYALSYGTTPTTGSTTAHNDGTTPTHPVLTFTGPVTTPRAVNHTSGLTLEYGVTLVAGDTLVVDTAAGTVILNGTAGRASTATAASSPEEAWTLLPGDNLIDFRAASAYDPASTLTITWRDANI